MKLNFIITTFAIIMAAATMTSCKEDKAVSVSPSFGSISIVPAAESSANKLYTGQLAKVEVKYSNLGEHVYFSSSTEFTCKITQGGKTVSETKKPVYEVTNGVVVPVDFYYPITLPAQPGKYTVTITSPFVQKAAASGEEGEQIMFSKLSASADIYVTETDLENANFGDSREYLKQALGMKEITLSAASDYDAIALCKDTVNTSWSHTTSHYLFQNNGFSAIDNVAWFYDKNGKKDEQGAIVVDSIRNDSLLLAIMDGAKAMFEVDVNKWDPDGRAEYSSTKPELTSDSLYTAFGAISGRTDTSSNANKTAWRNFLNAMLYKDIDNYTINYFYINDAGIRKANCNISIYAKGAVIYMEKKMEKAR